MSTILVTYDTAKRHLKLPDDAEQATVEEQIQSATAIVLRHIDREVNEWDVDTDASADLDFAIVRAAILEVLGDMYRNRGDDPDLAREDPAEGAFLRANVRRKLHPLRMPTIA